MAIDLTRFARFLTIAQQSTHDGEKMNAFGMACKMLDLQRLTFTEYLNSLQAQPRPNARHDYNQTKDEQRRSTSANRHAEMLAKLLNDDWVYLSQGSRKFLESLQASFEQWGRLTEKQGAALERVFKEKFPNEAA